MIHGDFELVIKQMTSEYQARHPRMRSYRNASEDLIELFEECEFNMIPIMKNCIADSLATFVADFKVPMHPGGRYEIQVKHMPPVPNNVKSWQVFEYDKNIQKFLTLTGEFDGLSIDEENELLKKATLAPEPLQNQNDVPEEMA